jgi:hypothetical protein
MNAFEPFSGTFEFQGLCIYNLQLHVYVDGEIVIVHLDYPNVINN